MPTTLARFEMPNRLVKDESTATETYGKFTAEPFEGGYGHTIGKNICYGYLPVEVAGHDRGFKVESYGEIYAATIELHRALYDPERKKILM